MKFRETNLAKNVNRKIAKVGLQLKKNSPEILVCLGVVGVVSSGVMACMATTKIDSVLAETKENIEKTNNYVETSGYSDRYTEEDHKKDLRIYSAKGAMELVKLYAPSVSLGVLSITAILSGHHVLKKRNVALASAYNIVSQTFKDYRNNVIERFGEELDKELRYNIKAEEVEETIQNEDGTETVITKTVPAGSINEASEYARYFDNRCNGYSNDHEFNLNFLRDQQRYANDLLKHNGFLFLNEVYDMLGIPRTQAGQVVGWLYDEKNPNGDNEVNFGIYDMYDRKKRDFVNGYEKNILLDFNVDGVIFDKI